MNLARSTIAALASGLLACSSGQKTSPVETVSQAETNANVFHANWSGASAYGNAYGQFSSLSFQAWENKTQQTRSTYLQFFGYGTDPSSKTCFDEQICKWNGAG